MQLFMLKIGARPQGRLIEQHDVMFVIANSLSEVIPVVNKHWSEVKGSWHLDAWRAVNRVGNYQILLRENSLSTEADKHLSDMQVLNLYFVNLGGYLPNHFEEFHYKTLVVAESLSHATAQAKKSEFYQHYTFKNVNSSLSGVATSHVDDKHLLAVDDIHAVADLLPNGFGLTIRALTEQEKTEMPHDTLHIGYLNIKQIKMLIS